MTGEQAPRAVPAAAMRYQVDFAAHDTATADADADADKTWVMANVVVTADLARAITQDQTRHELHQAQVTEVDPQGIEIEGQITTADGQQEYACWYCAFAPLPDRESAGIAQLTAAAINPAAGDHPIPQDPRELAAAFAAGWHCWRAYPYLARRYGKPGERFTDSDSAWLVTLVDYPQAYVNTQIDWLAAMLARRGMPRLLLQCTLARLHEALCQRVPARAARYAKLLAAAEHLAAQRRASLTDAEFDMLSQRFDESVDPAWLECLAGTGELLVAAVADESSGLDGALPAVRDWLTEPQRFPDAWIAAVQQTIAATETAIQAKPSK